MFGQERLRRTLSANIAGIARKIRRYHRQEMLPKPMRLFQNNGRSSAGRVRYRRKTPTIEGLNPPRTKGTNSQDPLASWPERMNSGHP